MTTIKVTVEDENADLLKKLLREVSFVKNVEEEEIVVNKSNEPESSYDRIKKILNEAKGKNLFADIKDPVEWQRELRKEWDRDF
ncbi:hypothetical protein [Mucilaginibacter sp.]|uniref:hypothetical protein n=1 Tax=Mucilaginibacter sp. TaxID=1882438 RepID=UPI00262C1009|nr:hypothetical protein [Mucilaginibacter sp.]MDB4921372.1 hypothetical protein [Mucilaginibacter sp.]